MRIAFFLNTLLAGTCLTWPWTDRRNLLHIQGKCMIGSREQSTSRNHSMRERERVREQSSSAEFAPAFFIFFITDWCQLLVQPPRVSGASP